MYFAFLRLRFGLVDSVFCAVAMVGQVVSHDRPEAGRPLQRLVNRPALFPLVLLIAGVIPVLLVMHWRKGNREAGILLIPSSCRALSIYTQVVFFLSQIPALAPAVRSGKRVFFPIPAGPFQLSLYQFTELSYLLSLAIIMVLRSTQSAASRLFLKGRWQPPARCSR
jgi:hypothetical protein